MLSAMLLFFVGWTCVMSCEVQSPKTHWFGQSAGLSVIFQTCFVVVQVGLFYVLICWVCRRGYAHTYAHM